MNNNENFALNGACLDCKKASFNFCKAEDGYNGRVKAIEENEQKLGEKPSIYQATIAICAVVAAAGLAFLEVYNSSQGLASLGIPTWTSYCIGGVVFILGMLSGENLGEGLRTMKRSEFNGKRVMNAKTITGIVMTIMFLLLQFAISYTAFAESGTSVFVFVYVMLISIFELLVGAIFWKGSILTIGILIARVKNKYIKYRMGKLSARAEKLWQKYLYSCAKSSIAVTPIAMTTYIKRAIDYYNGRYTAPYPF
jgi:hypothetical protein